MDDKKLTTLEQLRQFLAGTAEVALQSGPNNARHIQVADVLRRFH